MLLFLYSYILLRIVQREILSRWSWKLWSCVFEVGIYSWHKLNCWTNTIKADRWIDEVKMHVASYINIIYCYSVDWLKSWSASAWVCSRDWWGDYTLENSFALVYKNPESGEFRLDQGIGNEKLGWNHIHSKTNGCMGRWWYTCITFQHSDRLCCYF